MATVLLSSGCEYRELVSSLDARQAVEIEVLLGRSGITAEREKTTAGRSATFSIRVSDGDYEKAVALMHDFGLPREQRADFAELTSGSRFMPAPPQLNELRRERVHAMEIEELLQTLPNVVDATAVVRLAAESAEPDARLTTLPSATVVIRYTPKGGQAPFDSEEAGDIVSRSVPGLQRENVVVKMVRVDLPGQQNLVGIDPEAPDAFLNLRTFAPFSFSIPTTQESEARKQLALLILAVLGGGALFGYVLGTLRRRGQHRRSTGPQTFPDENNFFIESSREPPRDGARRTLIQGKPSSGASSSTTQE